MKDKSSGFLLGAVIAFFVAGGAIAQDEFSKAHGRFLLGAAQPKPTLVLDASYQPRVDAEGSGVETDLTRVGSRLGLAFEAGEDVGLATAIDFGLRRYDFKGAGLDLKLYKVALELGASWFFRDDLLISAIFRPGIFSDLEGSLEAADFQYQGSALGIYQLSDRWFLKLGVAVGEDLDESRIVPIGGFSWVPSDRLRVDVLLPVSASVTWQPFAESSFRIAPGVYLEGQQYHIETPTGDGDLQIQDIRFDVTTSLESSAGIRLSFSLGSNFRGAYEARGDGGFKLDAEQKPSVYLAIGLGATF